MEITVSEFRRNTKRYFDDALRGEVVCIERGGVHYNLTARIPTGAVIVPAPEKIIEPIKPSAIDTSGERSCCEHPYKMCQHWVWDSASGEGYRNTLSGRYREAE